MGNLVSALDLVQDALDKAGEKTDGTSDYQAEAVTFVDKYHKKIISGGNVLDLDCGEPWTWAKSKFPALLTLLPQLAIGTATVAVTQGSNQITFAVAPTQNLTGWVFHVADTYEYYRITNHVAGQTTATLDGIYMDDTSAASPFSASLIDYDIPVSNLVRLIGPMKVYKPQTSDADYEGKIVGLDDRSFSKKYPLYKLHVGTPTEFCIISNSNGVTTVRFNKAVELYTRVEVDHIPLPADLTYDSSSIPLIPEAHREVLSLATAFELCTLKKDSEAQTYFGLAQRELKALMNANRKEFMQISKNRGRLIARLDDFGVRNWPTSGR